jgi:hypothetical protein
MPSSDHANGQQLHTHCKRCGYPFDAPTTQEVCDVRGACDRRLHDPTYRVPPGRLSAVEERVRQYLIERAAKTDPGHPFQARVTYGDLCQAIDPEQQYWAWPRFRGIGKVLGRISTFEHEQGRPMLSALVVHAGDYQAGDGFAGLGRDLGYQIQLGQERAFWRSQMEAVVQYWTGPGKNTPAPTPIERALALLASMSEELDEVRRLLGAA